MFVQTQLSANGAGGTEGSSASSSAVGMSRQASFNRLSRC